MDDGEDSGDIIDSEGRLFGYVNIIDALVVLLVVAIAVAGIALVFPSGSTQQPTTNETHITLDLGVQPGSVASAINVGDNYAPERGSNLTITDVYRVPEGSGQRTVIRAEIDAQSTVNSINFDGTPPRLGRDITIVTDRYNATGDIRAVGESSTLPTSERTVVLETTLPTYRATDFASGQRIQLGDRTIATIDNVARYELDDADRTRVTVQASLETLDRNGLAYFGGTLVQEGETVLLPGEEATVSTEITRVGTGFERSTATVLVRDTVTTDEAAAISDGDTYLAGEESVATIESVVAYDTGQPDRKEVYATLSLETLDFGDRPRFSSTVLRQGASIPFRTDAYDLSATIERVGTGLQQETTNVLVRDTVTTDEATSISEGDTYLVGERSVATIDSVAVYDTGNTDQKLVYANVALQTLNYGDQPRFGSAVVRRGASVPFEGEDYELSGSIQRVGADLQQETTNVLVSDTMTSTEAGAISEGDTYLIAERSAATIDSVAVYDTGNTDQKLVYANVSLQTLNYGDQPRFGSTLVRRGASVPFETETYDLSGTIERIGSGLQQETTNVLLTDTVTNDEASEISEGDVYFVSNRSVATLESVAIYDTGNQDRKDVYANVSLQTLNYGDLPRFGSTLVRRGASVPFETEAYDLSGSTERIGAGLQRTSTTVLVTDTVSAEDAAAISEGDTYSVSGRSVGTVESVAAYGTGNPDRRQVYVGLSLETLGYGDLFRFGSTIVDEGASIPFQTNDYELDATIQRIGTTEQAGTPTTRSTTIEIRNVEPAVADSIEVGLTETNGDQTVARVTSVERESAKVVLTSDDGQIYEREHPRNEDVTITAELQVRQTDAGIRFKGDLLQQGNRIRLNLGVVTIRGELVRPI